MDALGNTKMIEGRRRGLRESIGGRKQGKSGRTRSHHLASKLVPTREKKKKHTF